jgi:hypothetical protein
MSLLSDSVRVRQIAYLHQACVLVLAADGSDRSLESGLAEAVQGTSRIVVVDGIELDVLPDQARRSLVEALRRLELTDRHLIVVNVPEAAVVDLRSAGVDVSATTDRVYVADPSMHPDRDAVASAFSDRG